MNKKLLELLDKINDKKGEVRSLVDQGKIEEAKTAKEELKRLQDEFDILKDLEDTGAGDFEDHANKGKKLNKTKDSVKEFADAARKGFRNSMNEGTVADGGYTVPEDIQTKINERRTAKASLIDLVDEMLLRKKDPEHLRRELSRQDSQKLVREEKFSLVLHLSSNV